MSRSYKKNPVGPIACCGKGAGMRKAKRLANRVVRRQVAREEDPPSGNKYRRRVERYMFPDDGKQWLEPNDWKSYRK